MAKRSADEGGRGGAGIVKVALTAAAGASIEWYDFFIYGTAAALVFPKVFFPSSIPPMVAQIAAFSTFAVGFLARPVGGVLFGHFGDIVGRKRALVTALIAMGLATAAIGLLPGYGRVGVLAPVLLVVLRFIQGVAVGGQWGGATLLSIESAPLGRKGFYGGVVQISAPLGMLAANLVFLVSNAVATPGQFMAWGWRIPFLLSLLLVLMGLYVQFNIEESAEFGESAAVSAEAPRRGGSPVAAVLLSHPAEVFLAGGAFMANNACFYIAITYAVAYGTASLHLSRALMLAAVMIASAVMIGAVTLFGWISDYWGRRGPYLVGAALLGVWALVFFPLLKLGTPVTVTLAITVELIFLALMYGPQAALFAELFPVKLRYSGASLGYQLGGVLGGGFAPIIATALVAKFHSSTPIAIYMAASCAISFVAAAGLCLRPVDQTASAAPQAVQ